MSEKKTGSRHPIAPEVTASDDRDGVVISRHPSFATVGFFAMHGSGGSDLFGANVRVANTIRMRICRAHMETGTVDRVHEDETILELELSESTFTQAITQFNRGTGSPATLRQAPDIGIAPVVYPQIARVDVEERLKNKGDHRVETEIKKIMEAFEVVRSLAEADGSVSKKALQGAVKSLGYAMDNLPGNLDYFRKLLREDADRLLDEAKLELHASASLIATEGAPPLKLFDDRETSE